jgi:hypothetical protein
MCVQEAASAAVAAAAALSTERARAECAEARLAEAAAAQAAWGPALAARDSAAVREARNAPARQHADTRCMGQQSSFSHEQYMRRGYRLSWSVPCFLARQRILHAIHAP